MNRVPKERIRPINGVRVTPQGGFVLYWMVASRRPFWNYALQRAVELCLDLGKPLLVLEALRCGHRWATARTHAFIIEGMAENQRVFDSSPALYYPYLEGSAGEGSGLLSALGAGAAAVVTDDFPCFFLPRMVASAGARIACTLEAVDSCCLLPLSTADRDFQTAHSFRRFVQKSLPPRLFEPPEPQPLSFLPGFARPFLQSHILERWPPAARPQLEKPSLALKMIAVDRSVSPVSLTGGHRAGARTLDAFLTGGLENYAELRNHPDETAASGLSPYLHFGHISPHQVFAEIASLEGWAPDRLSARCAGQREGWWGMSPGAEAFLDQLVTWRELGYNFCRRRGDYDRYGSLPEWSRRSLERHGGDARPHLYNLEELDAAKTHDPLWNAAQRQLLREGMIHNYLRMLWGKKVLEWSPSPEEALDRAVELNNLYALDGRDPNSYSGIFWVFGRFDRPWGPERPMYGTIRYMSSRSAAKKLRLSKYLEKYSG